MRILINGAPILGRRTGVGQYGLNLLCALAQSGTADNRPQLGVFDGADVWGIDPFLESIRDQPAATGEARWQRAIRRLWPGCREWADRRRRWRLTRSTKLSQWDLFHETNFVSPALDLPLVTTVHDMGYLRCPQFMPSDRLAWLRRRMAQTLARSRVVVTNSHFTRTELLDLCPQVDANRVLVTHLGVDLDDFARSDHAGRMDQVRRRFRLPGRFLLYLGTLEPRKNLQGLLRAYCTLPQSMQAQNPLVLAGMPGWNQEYFRRDIDQLRSRGVLHEIGYVGRADVAPLMMAASVFCFPSLYEGFGLPPLEAAACGTPVLCSNAGSLPEVLGDAASYADPSQPDDIAHQLRTLLEDGALRQKLSLAGPARAAMFSWQNCAKRTLDAYRAAA